MNAIDFEEANATFGKPPSWEDNECSPARVWVGETGHLPPRQVMVTCWEATEEEVQEFLKTGKIYVTIFHNVLPPMNLSPLNPFRVPDEPTPPNPADN